MLYGMTNRAGWTGEDPNNNAGVWGLWDLFKITHADLYGYWNSSAPVKIANHHNILATSWVQHEARDVLVAIGSWNPGTTTHSQATERMLRATFAYVQVDRSIHIVVKGLTECILLSRQSWST